MTTLESLDLYLKDIIAAKSLAELKGAMLDHGQRLRELMLEAVAREREAEARRERLKKLE